MHKTQTGTRVALSIAAAFQLRSRRADKSRYCYRHRYRPLRVSQFREPPVELKGTQTGVSRSTTTNQTGVYRFDAVDLGEHDLTVKAQGFRTDDESLDQRAGCANRRPGCSAGNRR